jgi:hypothetical protein
MSVDDEVPLSEEQFRMLLALEEDSSGKVRTDDLIRSEVDAYEKSLKAWRLNADDSDGCEEDVSLQDGDPQTSSAAPTKKKASKKPGGTVKKSKKESASVRSEKENIQPTSGSSAVVFKGGASSRPYGSAGPIKEEPFTFATLVKKVLLPEDRAGGDDSVTDALLSATHIHLEGAGLYDSTILECLGGATHCYLQHNMLRHVEGLEMMFRLTVAVFHHNNVTTLEPLAALPCLTFLDASYNAIAELDVEKHLPCEPLRSINLTGNPCAPNYDLLNTGAADAEQLEYVNAYRAELARCCRHLRNVDGQPLQGLDSDDGHLLRTMANEAEQEAAEGEAAAAGNAMITNFHDADFYDEENIPSEADADFDLEAAPSGTPHTMNNDGSSGDDEKTAASGGRTKKGPATAKRAAPSSSGSSHVQSITTSLLARYQTERESKQDAVQEAVGAANAPLDDEHLVVANDDDDDAEAEGDAHTDSGGARAPAHRESVPTSFAGIDGYRRAAANQAALRTELRFAQNHQSQLAMMLVANTWDEAEQRRQRRQEDAMERQGRLAAARLRPSAAYLAALETLERESGGKGLDHYRRVGSSSAPASSAPQ